MADDRLLYRPMDRGLLNYLLLAANREFFEFFSDKVVLCIPIKIAALGKRVCAIVAN